MKGRTVKYTEFTVVLEEEHCVATQFVNASEAGSDDHTRGESEECGARIGTGQGGGRDGCNWPWVMDGPWQCVFGYIFQHSAKSSHTEAGDDSIQTSSKWLI